MHTEHDYSHKEATCVLFLKTMWPYSNYSHQWRAALALEILNADGSDPHPVWMENTSSYVAVTNELSQCGLVSFLLNQSIFPFKGEERK